MTPIVPILIIVGVGVLAMVMRSSGGGTPSGVGRGDDADAPHPDDRAPSGDAFDEEDLEDGRVEAAAITSDGWAFVPRGNGVEMVPPGEDDELIQLSGQGSEAARKAMAAAPVNPQTGKRLIAWKPGETLGTGDMIAARVVRGAPDSDPWRLEALGRDYDYRWFAFETQDAANTALSLIQERIVRGPRDADGAPIPVGAEDFAVAKRQYAETEEALAMESDEEDPDSQG